MLNSVKSGVVSRPTPPILLNIEEDFVSYQLQSQVNAWWQIVSNKETFNTYQKTLQTTWQILQETTKLLWLFLCLGLVLFTWLWENTQRSGQQLKAWVDSIPEPKGEHIWEETRTRLIALSRTSTTSMIAQAREQLGLSAIAPETATALSSQSPSSRATTPPQSVVVSDTPAAEMPSTTTSPE
jgi:hypothetical protein